MMNFLPKEFVSGFYRSSIAPIQIDGHRQFITQASLLPLFYSWSNGLLQNRQNYPPKFFVATSAQQRPPITHAALIAGKRHGSSGTRSSMGNELQRWPNWWSRARVSIKVYQAWGNIGTGQGRACRQKRRAVISPRVHQN
jgi:hypothetical protein